jgi:hypothetical protein
VLKEQQRKEAAERERQRREAEQKELAMKQEMEAERQRQEEIRRERERKEGLEARGQAYYPLPVTVISGKTAEQWGQLAQANPREQEKAITALVEFKAEGIPFILQIAEARLNATSPQRIESIIAQVSLADVHFNDLPKIIAWLDKDKVLVNAPRMVILRHLSTRKESSKYFDKIDRMVNDLKKLPDYKAEVKALLDTIKAGG